jgi:hypothetical protein
LMAILRAKAATPKAEGKSWSPELMLDIQFSTANSVNYLCASWHFKLRIPESQPLSCPLEKIMTHHKKTENAKIIYMYRTLRCLS